MLKSGAYVDIAEHSGRVPLDYAPDLNYFLENGKPPKNLLETRLLPVTVEEIIRLRRALGTYYVPVSVDGVEYKDLKRLAWNSILSQTLHHRKHAAQMLRNQICFYMICSAIDLESDCNKQFDRVFSLLDHTLNVLASTVEIYRNIRNQDPSFVECLQGNSSFILN